MSSMKGRIVRLLSSVAAKRATVVAVEEHGGFRRLLVRSEVAHVSAGTKVQVLLPSNDMRTYSPIASRDGMTLLAWNHGGGPGGRWMSQARAGDELVFVGPQRSLEIDTGPVVLVGDETSLAVAAAFAVERPGQIHAVIQSDSAADVRAAAASVGLDQLDVLPRGDTAATVRAVESKVRANALVAVTGGSALIVAIRDDLRRAGVQNIKTKTYWIPGRTGLD